MDDRIFNAVDLLLDAIRENTAATFAVADAIRAHTKAKDATRKTVRGPDFSKPPTDLKGGR